jgi:hypothetical protein
VAFRRATELGHEIVRARGSELESDFAFGVVRQLFERRPAGSQARQRDALLAARQPLLTAVDDAHWADEPSLRWLAYLAPRLEGLPVALLVALRPSEPALTPTPLLGLRAEAATVLRPSLLSQSAVSTVVRATTGARATDELCTAVHALADLGGADDALAARLEGELVVAGLHDAWRAARFAPVLARLGSRRLGTPSEALAVAQGVVLAVSKT